MLTRVKLKELIPIDNIRWSDKQKALVKKIANDYNEKINIIWVSKYNEIIDGNHRHSILLNEFGGEYEITVRKFNISLKNYNRICLLFFPISITIIWPIYILVEKIKIKKYE